MAARPPVKRLPIFADHGILARCVYLGGCRGPVLASAVNAGRKHLGVADFAPVVEALFGKDGAGLLGVERLAGGSRKGVCRLILDVGPESATGGSVVAYVWNDDENYWPTPEQADSGDPSPDSGCDRFVAAHRALEVPVSTCPAFTNSIGAGRTLPVISSSLTI